MIFLPSPSSGGAAADDVIAAAAGKGSFRAGEPRTQQLLQYMADRAAVNKKSGALRQFDNETRRRHKRSKGIAGAAVHCRRTCMWYLVLSRLRPGQEENKRLHLPEHRQWLEDQHRAGRVLFSGPTADRSCGIYVLLAASLIDAANLAAQDPDHLRGIGAMEVLEWNAHRAFRLDGPAIAEIERLANPAAQDAQLRPAKSFIRKSDV